MENCTKSNFFENISTIIVISIILISISYLAKGNSDLKNATRYCKYNSNSELCQKLTTSCSDWGTCINKADDTLEIHTLVYFNDKQISKMAENVRKYEREKAKQLRQEDRERAEEIRKEIHSIEIK